MGVGVEDVAVDAQAPHGIAHYFEHARWLPSSAIVGNRGKRLGTDNGNAVHIGDGRGQLDGMDRVDAGADPELSHDDAGLRAHLEALEGTVVRLDREFQAVLAAEIGEVIIVVLREILSTPTCWNLVPKSLENFHYPFLNPPPIQFLCSQATEFRTEPVAACEIRHCRVYSIFSCLGI